MNIDGAKTMRQEDRESKAEEQEKHRLKKVLSLSIQCSNLWKKVLDTAATIPSPFTFFDGAIHMGPASHIFPP